MISRADPEVVIRRVRFEPARRDVTVAMVEDVTPGYRRITFTGDDLATFQSLNPGDHVKLRLPAPSGGDGDVIVRDYTPRWYSQADRTLVIDFVIHGDGPASSWARQAAPGQSVTVMGPRGSGVLESTFDWFLQIGDETALPAIARRLEEADHGERHIAVIEVDSAANEQPIRSSAKVEVHWVHRNGAEPGSTNALEQAVRALQLDGGSMYVWAGGEATTLREIRRYLKDEAGIPIQRLSFHGHWKRGMANFDHHQPIED